MEMTVVVAAVAMFVALGLPAIHALINSFQTEAGTRAMIGAALSSARALAAKEQRYAGIRFQKAYNLANPLKAPQYMVFIVHEEPRKMDTLTIGFRAADGSEPMKLPDTVGVMDLIVRINHNTHRTDAEDTEDQALARAHLDDRDLSNLGPDGKNMYVIDTTTFSIIFSPSGKLVVHQVRTRNREGHYQPNNAGAKVSLDDIFNSPLNIRNFDIGMFVQDDYAEMGLGAEFSRNSFVIYDAVQFAQMSPAEKYDYLYGLERIYINPYTGTVINR